MHRRIKNKIHKEQKNNFQLILKIPKFERSKNIKSLTPSIKELQAITLQN